MAVPLGKGAAIACEARLAVNVDKLTELAIIMLKEHKCSWSAVMTDEMAVLMKNGGLIGKYDIFVVHQRVFILFV